MLSRYEVEFTRPANATVYTAGDVVNSTATTPLTLFAANDLPRDGRIVAAKLSISNANITNGTFRLFFFEEDGNVGTLTDNSAFAMTPTKEEELIGYSDFTLEITGSVGGSVAWDLNTGLNIPFVQTLNSSGEKKGLYGILIATGAYNPVGELTVVDITVFVESDAV